MHEYVEYNRLNKRQDFFEKYSSLDMLLVDDIQFITKWAGISEQFFTIFNRLMEQGKQVVLTSDRPPDNIPDLEHRIKSRFEWGAIVDILPYELEGRLAILKNKLAERQSTMMDHIEIPEEVLYFLASSIRDNVRKLEGALNRLIGVANLKFADTKDAKITLEFAREALKPIIPIRRKQPHVERIQEYVAKKYNLKVDDMLSKSNRRDIAFPRQIAMYVSKKLTSTPLNVIGEKFGGNTIRRCFIPLKKLRNGLIRIRILLRKWTPS